MYKLKLQQIIKAFIFSLQFTTKKLDLHILIRFGIRNLTLLILI